jgi:hypothetical protein
MPYALAIIAILLIVSGARGTYGDLKKLLVSDFTGDNNFMYWIAALGAVGVIGYVPQLEKFSRAFITLILISMILSQQGFAQKFLDAIGHISSGGDNAGSGSGSGPMEITVNPSGATANPLNTDMLGNTIREFQGITDFFKSFQFGG